VAEDKVRQELTELLYHNFWGVIASNVATSLAAVVVLRRAIPIGWLLIWFGAICLLCSMRGLAAVRFRRTDKASRSSVAWDWLATGFSWISGALWGALGWEGFVPEQPLVFSFTMVVLTGIVCGTVPALSAFPPALVGSILATATPLGIRGIQSGGDIAEPYTFLVFTLVAINFYYCRGTHRMLRQTIALRLENEELAGKLIEERDRAKLADQSKTRFLAAASHDLRQPIYALGLLMSRLAMLGKRGDVPESEAGALAEHSKSLIGDLNGLLDALLDISKLDAGVVTIDRQSINLRQLFVDLQVEFSMNAYRCNLDWRVIDRNLEVDSDLKMLRRIINNLLSNAFRYTKQGGVLLGCRKRGEFVEIQVWDTGIGIAREQQSLIFEEFLQLHNPERDRTLGMGLGLAIVKRTAALLDHPIRLVSSAGRGSMFSVLVPIATRETHRSETARAELESRSLGIVVIEDERNVLEALKRLLILGGHRVYADRSAQLAKDALRTSTISLAEVRVDLIIADYRLGDGTTGIEAIGDIRRYIGENIPAVIVTGDTSPERLKEVMALGELILHKPIDGDDLLRTIEWISTRGNSIR